jgi:predicted RNase H-like nuclease (RuvC/YqgF family)
MATLYDLVLEANKVEEALFKSQGEVSPEFENWIQEIDHMLEVKADNYAHVLDRIESTIEQLKSNAQQYQQAAKSLENHHNRIKERIKSALIAMNRESIAGEKKTFSLASCAQRLLIDVTELDPAYLMEKRELVPDKERIKADLKEGQTIKGAHLEGGKSLRITVTK